MMKHIYTPKLTPMNVMVFFSGGASSAKAMLNDKNHGKLYRVFSGFTDKADAEGYHTLPKLTPGVHVYRLDRKEFYKLSNRQDKRNHFYELVDKIVKLENPDIIALCGYMHIISDPLLSGYEGRILNVHPSDLSILDKNGKRKYTGDDAVLDSIKGGEKSIRSTVHITTKAVDGGPILVQSKPMPIETKHGSEIREYAKALQERMKKECDGPAYLKALELIAQGKVAIDDSRLFLDGKELPYHGYRLDDLFFQWRVKFV